MADSKLMQIPRVLICAPCSGSGKTLITCALMHLLGKRGYKVSAFKCGPDYIDPMFHKKVLGVPSRNLDLFLAGKEGVKRSLRFGANGSDISIIEGVMGFYDGMGATSMEGSSYDLCLQTGTPAILVVNCKGMSRSIIPMIKGFVEYGNPGAIRGVILNNISPMIAREISAEIEKELGIAVVGYLPKLEGEILTSRHLGLVMPDEVPDILKKIDEVADRLAENLDIEKILKIATEAEPESGGLQLHRLGADACMVKGGNPVVGVAFDEAFCFYYEDNLELLQEMGAELKFFSPIHDKEVPDVDRILIGGGYPELFAKELSENRTMLDSIRRAASEGVPIIAECGGFLYLQERLTDTKGHTYEMAGVMEGTSHMTGKLSHFGYVNVTALQDTPYLMEGETIRGHEFHYYDTTENGEVCRMDKPSGKRSWQGYQIKGNIFAGFAHLYYPSYPEFVTRFLNL